ncbi:MAG: c-type cytochrome [Thermomicrobiales bacterium]
MNLSTHVRNVTRSLLRMIRGPVAAALVLVAMATVLTGAAAGWFVVRMRRRDPVTHAGAIPPTGADAGNRPQPRGWTRTRTFRFLMLLVTVSTAVGVVGAAVLIAPRAAVMTLFADEAPAVTVEGGDAGAGKDALRAYGCIACHTVPGMASSSGATVGPPLTAWAERVYIAGSLTNQPENLIFWIQNPQQVEPGTAMPDLDVTEQDARDIAAYLYTLDD